MSDINPSLVSSELTTIETFKDTTEKRGSKLTLNELNYISDKQLHAKGGSGEDPFSEFPVVIEIDARNFSDPGDISNLHARYLKGGYSEIRECPTNDANDGDFMVLEKLWFPNSDAANVETIYIHDENGVLSSEFALGPDMLFFNPDGTITFRSRD